MEKSTYTLSVLNNIFIIVVLNNNCRHFSNFYSDIVICNIVYNRVAADIESSNTNPTSNVFMLLN